MTQQNEKPGMTRRQLLRASLRTAGFAGLAAAAGLSVYGSRTKGEDLVWQIDPAKCTQCGRCATECVLTPSAVKCVHSYDMCGYCDWCFAYFDPVSGEPGTGAEDLLCPIDAISREHIEDIYYEYKIDEEVCIGCAKCVRGCQASGNGSLYLQVMRTLCSDCNECKIATACPAEAFCRIPASESYLLKTRGGKH